MLVQKEVSTHQPIYFVSHALKRAELNFTTLENLTLALVITAQKLMPYFLSYTITVLTNNALGESAPPRCLGKTC